MDGSEIIRLRSPMDHRQPGQVGIVTTISGFKLSCLLFGSSKPGSNDPAYATIHMGALVKVPTPTTCAYGFVSSLRFDDGDTDTATCEIDLLGESTIKADTPPTFARGISVFPVLGSALFPTTSEDIAIVYAKPNTWTLQIGTLHQDAARPAYLLSQEFLSKHSAILGTTGSGKSCALTLILRTLLTAHPNGHVVMLDPHGEYATAFSDLCERITPETLQLPYWLLSFEEICEVLCSHDPIARSREIPILKDAILQAKMDFLGNDPVKVASLTVDTPTPYRLTGVVSRINDGMGKLDRPDSCLPYLRLSSTIENMRKDRRFAFMFEGLAVRDNMAEILSRIIRIPVDGHPITILDISAVPS